jgi:DNA replication protein DnaC
VAKSRIDETLKKIATSTSKANTPITSSTDLAGDPNCPHCGGLGYLRADVPMGHPNFGRLEVCVCRRRDVGEQVRERLYSLSHLDEL